MMKQKLYAKISMAVLGFMVNATLLPGGFAVENLRNIPVKIRYAQTWCSKWGQSAPVDKDFWSNKAAKGVFGYGITGAGTNGDTPPAQAQNTISVAENKLADIDDMTVSTSVNPEDTAAAKGALVGIAVGTGAAAAAGIGGAVAAPAIAGAVGTAAALGVGAAGIGAGLVGGGLLAGGGVAAGAGTALATAGAIAAIGTAPVAIGIAGVGIAATTSAVALAVPLVVLAAPVALAALIIGLLSIDKEKTFSAKSCEEGGKEFYEVTIAPNETFKTEKLGVWYDVEVVDPTFNYRFEGEQKERYRQFHVPADQYWKMKIIK